jgi:hypothetical protein
MGGPVLSSSLASKVCSILATPRTLNDLLSSNITDALMGYVPKHENSNHNDNLRIIGVGSHGRD